MRVVFAPRVRAYIQAERNYLRQYSLKASANLTRRLRDAAGLLGRFPEIGMAKPLPIRGVRRLVVDDYVLDYEIVGDEVHVLSMRHGRQQDPDLDYDPDVDYER